MTHEWKETDKVESPETFTAWLSKAIAPSSNTNLIYRGLPKSQWHLQPSLDRKEPESSTYSDRLRIEEETIGDFCRQAHRFLGHIERLLIGGPKTTRMTVMQHFGAPTRLLDWTYSPAVAAYFASISYPKLDGTIWWIDAKAVQDYCTDNWKRWKIGRYPPELGGQVILKDYIFNADVPEFVTLLDSRVRISRAQAQRAMFTLASRLAVDHDAVLVNQLTKGKYGRITIKANMKSYALDSFELMGIDAVSLQYPGADKVGLSMAPKPE